MEGHYTGGTAAAVCETDDLEVIALDNIDMIANYLFDTIPDIGTVKIDFITLVSDEIRRIIGAKSVR
jgi:hypothetical protein